MIAQASTAASSSVRWQSSSGTWTTCCFTPWPVSCTVSRFTCRTSPLILGKLAANEQAAIVPRKRRWPPSLSVDDEGKLGPTADVEGIDENLVHHGTPFVLGIGCIRYRIGPLCAAAIICGLRCPPLPTRPAHSATAARPTA